MGVSECRDLKIIFFLKLSSKCKHRKPQCAVVICSLHLSIVGARCLLFIVIAHGDIQYLLLHYYELTGYVLQLCIGAQVAPNECKCNLLHYTNHVVRAYS